MKIGIIICSALFLAPFCGKDKLSITSLKSGSNLDIDGRILNHELVFYIDKYTKKGKVADLFNYIYFKGDTVCISAALNQKLKNNLSASINFINPRTGEKYAAERVTINGDQISGFSLLGSLLENFYKKELKNNIPERAYCCREIPLIASVKVRGNNFKIEKKSRFAFKIIYK